MLTDFLKRYFLLIPLKINNLKVIEHFILLFLKNLFLFKK